MTVAAVLEILMKKAIAEGQVTFTDKSRISHVKTIGLLKSLQPIRISDTCT